MRIRRFTAPEFDRRAVVELDGPGLVADANGGGKQGEFADHGVADLQRFLGKLPFQFTLLKSLRHVIKGPGELPQFIPPMAESGAGAEVTGGQTGAGPHERLDWTDDQETAAHPAEREGQAHGGSEPEQATKQLAIGRGVESLSWDAQDCRHFP